MEGEIINIENAFGTRVGAILSLCLHQTQIDMSLYFEQAMQLGAATELPAIMGLYSMIRYKKWHKLPQLLDEYLGAPLGVPSLPPQVPSLNPQGPPAATSQRASSTPMTNPTPLEQLTNWFSQSGKQLHELTSTRGMPKPQADNETELCLPYHFSGCCFEECQRSGTHHQPTGTEVQNMETFLDQCGVTHL